MGLFFHLVATLNPKHLLFCLFPPNTSIQIQYSLLIESVYHPFTHFTSSALLDFDSLSLSCILTAFPSFFLLPGGIRHRQIE